MAWGVWPAQRKPGSHAQWEISVWALLGSGSTQPRSPQSGGLMDCSNRTRQAEPDRGQQLLTTGIVFHFYLRYVQRPSQQALAWLFPRGMSTLSDKSENNHILCSLAPSLLLLLQLHNYMLQHQSFSTESTQVDDSSILINALIPAQNSTV